MSRGAGKMQRRVLELVAAAEVATFIGGATAAERASVSRAIKKLVAAGKIVAVPLWYGSRVRVAVARPGTMLRGQPIESFASQKIPIAEGRWGWGDSLRAMARSAGISVAQTRRDLAKVKC